MRDRPAGMQCPVDGATLAMAERAGIEIDYCPTCRGVWLDRGELDKIVERDSLQRTGPASQADPERQGGGWPERAPDRGPERGYSYRQDHRGHGQPKRKKSFLEELFD